MHIEAYLSVLSDEATIRAIHEEANIPSARIKQYTKVKAQWSITGEDMPWGWKTEPVPIDIDNTDDGLKALLSRHKPIFPVIKKYQGPKTGIGLVMVTRYEENEDPRGLYLSAGTISLLSELGAELGNDVDTYGLTLRKTEAELAGRG